MRVRFAPSPTGRLHVGGARTALFNWLLARHHRGTLLLRIEDTDVERSTRASESSLLTDLAWLGLEWDEGPDVGGPHGPYRQSERRELYARQAAALVAAGNAYPCFCTDAELEQRREARRAQGAESHYDGRCRSIPAATARRRHQAGEAHALRFRVRPGDVHFQDHIRGAMRIDAGTFGDFVLLRSNGLPTYNFACVVDDAAMRISHVVRGEDHLYNTARQCLLFEACAWPLPEFAHLPLILDEDRGKLRKREGRTGTYVDEYRSAGYLPAALVNFLALLGWSSPHEEELLARADLVRDFDLSRVNKSAAVFDQRKLDWMAAWHVRNRADADLAALALPFLHAAGLEADLRRAQTWVAAFKSDLPALALLPARVQALLDGVSPEAEAAAALASPAAARLLPLLAARLESADAIDGAGFKLLLQECGRELGLRGKDLFVPVRAALSGRLHGPELPLLFDLLGAERVRARLGASQL